MSNNIYTDFLIEFHNNCDRNAIRKSGSSMEFVRAIKKAADATKKKRRFSQDYKKYMGTGPIEMRGDVPFEVWEKLAYGKLNDSDRDAELRPWWEMAHKKVRNLSRKGKLITGEFDGGPQYGGLISTEQLVRAAIMRADAKRHQYEGNWDAYQAHLKEIAERQPFEDRMWDALQRTFNSDPETLKVIEQQLVNEGKLKTGHMGNMDIPQQNKVLTHYESPNNPYLSSDLREIAANREATVKQAEEQKAADEAKREVKDTRDPKAAFGGSMASWKVEGPDGKTQNLTNEEMKDFAQGKTKELTTPEVKEKTDWQTYLKAGLKSLGKK